MSTPHALRRTGLAVAALALAAAPALAQTTATPTFSLEGNVLYNVFNGHDFRDVGDGPGFEALGNLGVGAFSLGAGYVRTTHHLTDVTDDVTLDGPFVEPRLALPFYYRSFTPYLSARAARLTARADDAGGELVATGTQLGGGIGMLVALAPSVRMNLGLTYARLRLGDAERDGTRIPDSSADGSTLGFRAGLSLGGAGWGWH
jgi:hypothetical protein